MHTFQEQYRAIVNSKTPKEFFQNIPWGLIEILSAIPGMVFIASVAYQLVIMFTAPYGYAGATKSAGRIAAVIGVVVIVLVIGKKYTEQESPRQFFRQNIPIVFFLGLMLLMILSTCINLSSNSMAVCGDGYRSESIFSFLIYFAAYYFCSSMIRREKIKSVMIYAFLSLALIQNSIVLYFTFVLHKTHFFDGGSGRITGLYSQFNHYGYYLLLVIIFGFAMTILEKNKILKMLAFVNFLTGSTALVLNDTFGCFLACIFAMLFSVFAFSVVRRKICLPAIGLFVLFWAIAFLINFWQPTVLSNLITFSHDVSNIASGSEQAANAGTGRFTLWRLTLGYILEKPLFGYGVEGIAQRLYNDAGVYAIDRPHNEYLQYAVFFGIPAMLLYLGGLVSIFLSAWKNRKRIDSYSLAALCTAFAYLFSALFGNTMHYTAPYLFIFIGLSFGLSRTKASGETQSDSEADEDAP